MQACVRSGLWCFDMLMNFALLLITQSYRTPDDIIITSLCMVVCLLAKF